MNKEILKDGEPCDHPGCLNHISNSCEGCGRIGGLSMNLEITEKLIESVPQTYGEAIKLYPWLKYIKFESHEYDNRTTIENAIFLLKSADSLICIYGSLSDQDI